MAAARIEDVATLSSSDDESSESENAAANRIRMNGK
jgi:hypothetical protein